MNNTFSQRWKTNLMENRKRFFLSDDPKRRQREYKRV